MCSADGCHLAKPEESIINDDQVLVLKRIQQTIRAVDQRTGVERYSIYSYKLISCLIFLTDTCDVCTIGCDKYSCLHNRGVSERRFVCP